ncbi:MAG: GNAT family N-acetyltransferase [Defluviitaleaceae bacterium]|nr:GNAT family N-acetyltransferase [Defluviitaleaceae bacterium]MCL2263127.1 GNAT family N-acetyltransferase [Defluviitaleaceae bacterium]
MVSNYNEILHENAEIRTARLVLRKFRKEDAADVFEYASDEETMKFLTVGTHPSIDVSRGVIFNYFLSRTGIFAIEFDKKCIGCMDFRIDHEDEKGSFGYVLNRKYWGRGFMTEALTAVLELAFEKLELNRVESTHYVGNEGSGRVMQKCGMKFEGVGIREKKIKGVFRDVVHYAILKEHFRGGQK